MEASEDLTFGGAAITRLADERTNSVVHTGITNTHHAHPEKRAPMNYVDSQNQLMIHQQRHRQLEAEATAYRASGRGQENGRRRRRIWSA